MTWLYRYSIRHPRRVVVTAVLLTCAIAPGMLRLRLRTDGHALVPTDAPAIRCDQSVREAFGIEDPIVVFIESDHPDGIFNVHTLELVRDLTTAFRRMHAFGIDPRFQQELDDLIISPALRETFADHGVNLSSEADVISMDKELQWIIRDVHRWYTVEREDVEAELERRSEARAAASRRAADAPRSQPSPGRGRDDPLPPSERPLLVLQENVMSLATERGHRVRTGTLRFRKFLEPFPGTREQLDQLADDLRVMGIYTGILVSRRPDEQEAGRFQFDGHATAIFVDVPAGVDRTEFYRQIQDIIVAHGDVSETIHVIGAPVAESLLGTHILEDLGVPAAVLGHRLSRGNDDDTKRWPATFYELRRLIARHVGLLPVALVVMTTVFLVCFRSVAAVLLPLTEVAACLIVVFGLMGWCGVPVYLTIAVLPVILTVTGVTDEIHVFNRYAQQCREQPERDHVDVVTATMSEMYAPMIQTAVTTAVGFFSFALSPMAPVRVFGTFTTVGVVFCMLWSLTVIPAALVLLRPSRRAAPAEVTPPARLGGRPPFFARLGAGALRARHVMLVVAVVIAALTPFGLRDIVVQDSWIDGFAPDSEFYKATEAFNQQFLGTHILLLCVDTGSEVLAGELPGSDLGVREVFLPGDTVADPAVLVGRHIELSRVEPTDASKPPQRGARARLPWAAWIEKAERIAEHIVVTTSAPHGSAKVFLGIKDADTFRYEIKQRRLTSPEVLRRIGGLEAFIESRRAYAVGGVLGPAAYIRTTSFIVKARKEEHRCIPDDADAVDQTWKRYRLVRGEERLRQVLNENDARALVSVYMTHANFVDTAKLMAEIQDYEREHLAPKGITIEFAGDVAVSQTLIDAIVSTQVRSLLGSLIGIFAVTAVLGRSLWWGVCCVLPCGLAVLVNFAVMGWTGMPLGVATSMFAAMTLGIGVDYAIHLLERYQLARSRGADDEAALIDATRVAGPAIVIDALAVGLGFGVLVLSQVPANARLGGLLVLNIAACLTATLLLLPALVRVRPPRGSRHPAPAA